MAKEKLQKAKYSEWLASLTGASLIAFGLGVLFANQFNSYAVPAIVAGIALHSWGMFKTHSRNS